MCGVSSVNDAESEACQPARHTDHRRAALALVAFGRRFSWLASSHLRQDSPHVRRAALAAAVCCLPARSSAPAEASSRSLTSDDAAGQHMAHMNGIDLVRAAARAGGSAAGHHQRLPASTTPPRELRRVRGMPSG
jgi:hypothetical protein